MFPSVETPETLSGNPPQAQERAHFFSISSLYLACRAALLQFAR
jgi:hypothetical protein